jgi:hypothetical protein
LTHKEIEEREFDLALSAQDQTPAMPQNTYYLPFWVVYTQRDPVIDRCFSFLENSLESTPVIH